MFTASRFKKIMEFLSFNIGQIGQVILLLFGMGVMFQRIQGDIKTQSERLKKIEEEITDFRRFLVQNARLEEQIIALRSTVIEQGKRVDHLYGRIDI